MPLRKPWDHAIELKESFVLKKGRLIPLSPDEQQEVSDFIDGQLKKGYIQPSKLPQTSPMFFIPKKDGKKHMVQDYHYLNEHTVKNLYPLPLISQLVNKLKGCKLFTKMDLRWGYNNVRIKEGDEWKAAFMCHCGAFKPLVMFFGLCNLPTTFQNMMNNIFGDMEDVLIIYINDLMIFTKMDNQEEHNKIVLEVLRRLKINDLFVKPQKCIFGQQEVDFLGMIIGIDGVCMDPAKISAVQDWPIPTNIHRIMKPLNNLTKKDLLFIWDDTCQVVFDVLKEAFTTAPILMFPDQDWRFQLETDTSDYATGAVLSVECNDGLWRPVAYSSHSLSGAELNYTVHNKEMLAIICALEQWHHCLEATPYQFEIWTDHHNLKWFMTAQKLQPCQACWVQYFSQFNCIIIHKPGVTMGRLDALLRREDFVEGKERAKSEESLFINPSQVHSVKLENPFMEDLWIKSAIAKGVPAGCKL
ncbi:hypothetical protein M404DRAFT_30459 [Pisolithus tinctorius Marx 270]|uniref:Reverse transcriptase domain-containing protein n=1 Tax=Pisolithus tinctorius Marx 270 TaxID=870435 RepID=A0A0C3JPK0_PISTI|nr:hypothetical protein M404DRAFT_30459 [Pisolithus tinctorius Marx 270]